MTALFSSRPISHEAPSKAQQCRRNAHYCEMLAGNADDEVNRIRLLKMQHAWLALAANEEWLGGECDPHIIVLPIAH